MEYIFPHVIQIAITVCSIAFGGFLTLRSLDYRLGQVEARESNYVRRDVQDQVNMRIEEKIDLLLKNFHLEYDK